MSDIKLSRTLIEKSPLGIGNLHKTVPVDAGPCQLCIKRTKPATEQEAEAQRVDDEGATQHTPDRRDGHVPIITVWFKSDIKRGFVLSSYAGTRCSQECLEN